MTGKKIIDLAILGALTLVSIIALTIFIYTEVIYQRPLLDEQMERDSLTSDLKNSAIKDGLKIEKYVVNIKSETSRLRFLEVSFQVVPFKSEQKEILEKNKPMILDRIGQLAGKMTPDDLNSISGKILFEDRLKRRINEDLSDQIVREIYFINFVVQ